MSLIHDQIEFHNVAALEPMNGMPGLCPVRFPRQLRPVMNKYARTVPVDMAGVELRFVTECPQTRVAFTAHAGEVILNIFCGNFHQRELRIAPGTTHVLQLEKSPWFSKVDVPALGLGGFSHKVWRIQVSYGTMSYLGIETFSDALRPPTDAEKPRLRYLAFGSSINTLVR
ncbi:MAG: hypothetical protein LR015_08170 [Verrucomicrobia bacterium]|nr:hypothetical protein [Verrucomicrobiota bacterium]